MNDGFPSDQTHLGSTGKRMPKCRSIDTTCATSHNVLETTQCPDSTNTLLASGVYNWARAVVVVVVDVAVVVVVVVVKTTDCVSFGATCCWTIVVSAGGMWCEMLGFHPTTCVAPKLYCGLTDVTDSAIPVGSGANHAQPSTGNFPNSPP